MNEDTIPSHWTQIAGKLKQQWGKLTDDDLEKASGHREYLLSKLQQRDGLAREKAEGELRTLGYV
jgi:uncharacterized protein YjbJ (UPF0337 family)